MERTWPWFRLYIEIVEDRKLRRLPPVQRWVWIALLCAARKSPVPGMFLLSENVPGTLDDLADIAAVPLEDVQEAVAAFREQDMVGLEGAVLVLNHWGERQFESDSSTARWRRWRDKHRTNVGASVGLTPSDPDPDPDPDRESDLPLAPPAPTEELKPPKPFAEGSNSADPGANAHKVNTKVSTRRFLEFWALYPKKRSKGQAEKAWAKLKPDAALFASIMQGLERARVCLDWRKESGRYVPHPATWLNAKGWEDNMEVSDDGGPGKPQNSPGKPGKYDDLVLR